MRLLRWRHWRVLLVVVASTAAVAFGALARASDEGSRGRFHRQGGPTSPPLDLGPCALTGVRADPACVLQCKGAAESCMEQARGNLQSCLAAHCRDTLSAARTACSTGPVSPACIAAWRTYLACAQPCIATHRAAVSQCRGTRAACTTACPLVPCPVPIDPLCRVQCQAALTACVALVHRKMADCLSGCSGAIARARAACLDPMSTECQATQQAARACVGSCQTQRRLDAGNCWEKEKTCTASCITSGSNP